MQRFRLLGAFILVVASALAGSAPEPARAAGSFQVVINAANPAKAILRAEVVQCFMGKTRQWPDGQFVVPVDQSAKSPVRAAFSQTVLGLSVEAVQTHWTKSIHAGGSLPPLTAPEEDVLRMVAKEKRMMSYVSAEAVLPEGVKAVEVRD